MTHTIRDMVFLHKDTNHNTCNKSVSDILKPFEPYMLTIDNMIRDPILCVEVKQNMDNIENKSSISNANVNKDIPNGLQPATNDENNLISPRQQDSLFWCIYIAMHAYDEFLMIRNKHNAIEMEWKQQLSSMITGCPTKIKQSNHKITKANIQEILSDFMTSPCKTNMLCVIAISVYHNIHFVVMNSTNNMRMEFTTDNNEANTYVISKNDRNHYSICDEPVTAEKLLAIRSNSFLIENNEKPLKSVGSYKIDNLIEYATLFGVYNENEKYKKTELYKLVGDYIAKYNIII
jgi:hypothetical protein